MKALYNVGHHACIVNIGRRVVDGWDRVSRTIYEMKTGCVTLSKYRDQIERNVIEGRDS